MKSAKSAIIESFKQLASNKSIDKLTVKGLCEHCQINRQTFYNHFTDIIDVFKFIFFEELSSEISHNRTFGTWGDGFLATMHYLKRNSKIIMHVYHSSYWPEANSYLTDLSNMLLENVVGECVEKLKVTLREKDKSFIISFYRHVFNGLIIDWVKEGMKEAPETMLQRLLLMITGSIPRSVTAFISADIKD